ncbi:MAG: hypothetical protein SGPRY_004854 [Prymnesium sp.]
MASNRELGEVLDWLFAAKIEAADAFGCARRLVEAGVTSRDHIRALTPARAKELTPAKLHAKVLRAIKKMPTLQAEESAPPRKRRATDLGPAPPPPPPPQLPSDVVIVNRSPVMILWCAAVAQSALGMDWSAALSLASAAAALFARSKGHRLGLYSEGRKRVASGPETICLLGEEVPVLTTSHGLRGLSVPYNGGSEEETMSPVSPTSVQRSLSSAFGEHFGAAWHAMLQLASALPATALMDQRGKLAYDLYAECVRWNFILVVQTTDSQLPVCRFRPNVPDGLKGWGHPGRLSLTQIGQIQSRLTSTASSSSQAALAAAIGCVVSDVVPIVEELQLDGVLYEHHGELRML